MSVTGNRAAVKVSLEIAIGHREDVIELSDEELREYVVKYIEDWSAENREKFVDQIILELKDFFEKMASINEYPF